MKYSITFFASYFLTVFSYSQEITPDLLIKIKKEVETEVNALKGKLDLEKVNSIKIEFITDTFRIENIMGKCLDIDYSDLGMRKAIYKSAELYDGLLNKYYKKLLTVLSGEDKKLLVQAQKNWLSFRDSEMKLIETISGDSYAGGGTMERLTEASSYLSLIKERTVTLFEHFIRATQNY